MQYPYQCWFLINQNLRERPFILDEQSAVDTLTTFLSDKNYGIGISLFRFDIYVEPIINYGHYRDVVYSGCAHLTAHIDYTTFINADANQRHKLLLNSALILFKYLSEKIALSKKIDAKNLVKDYSKFLEAKSLLLTEKQASNFIIKIFNAIKFNFVITTTIEVANGDIHYDLNEIQDYINNMLVEQTFGTSIRQFDFGYELFDFNGQFAFFRQQTAELKRYGTKYKNLLIVKQFNYAKMKMMNRKAQLNFLKEKILEAISDIDNLNKKPKDFDKEKFYNSIENILTEYIEKT